MSHLSPVCIEVQAHVDFIDEHGNNAFRPLTAVVKVPDYSIPGIVTVLRQLQTRWQQAHRAHRVSILALNVGVAPPADFIDMTADAPE